MTSLAIGLAGGVLALVVRLVKGDGAKSLLRALETLLTGALGAFLAHAFIYLMLAAGGHGELTVTLTSLFFFIWPGLVNVVSQIASGHAVIGEGAVLWIALFVGGVVGVMDGLWATHKWLGVGPLAFLLDVTWGLGGSTNGVLLHLIDTIATSHADGPNEIRREAHRYIKGFRIKTDFVFTQGAVMSDSGAWAPGTDLFTHESIHVWQNRILGPFFWFSYASWMALSFLPSIVAGIIGKNVSDAIQWWTYFDNPWEVMAYRLANPSDRMGWGKPRWLCWPWPVAIALAPPVLAAVAALFIDLFAKAYI
ncbi:MAG TPA: hypothetical protein VMU08_14145 [Rhizomicrobium sp.]|nr:hypothetical protein [Rhizomicrobium sp.]